MNTGYYTVVGPSRIDMDEVMRFTVTSLLMHVKTTIFFIPFLRAYVRAFTK